MANYLVGHSFEINFFFGGGGRSKCSGMLHWLKSGKQTNKKTNKSKTPNCGSETGQVPIWSVHESVLYRHADGGGVLPLLYPAMLALPTQAEGERASLAKSRHQLELARSAGVS